MTIEHRAGTLELCCACAAFRRHTMQPGSLSWSLRWDEEFRSGRVVLWCAEEKL